jgi:hypothetical protein
MSKCEELKHVLFYDISSSLVLSSLVSCLWSLLTSTRTLYVDTVNSPTTQRESVRLSIEVLAICLFIEVEKSQWTQVAGKMEQRLR